MVCFSSLKWIEFRFEFGSWQVWFVNVPHTRLVEDKGGQNWITKVKDKFVFPGGGTSLYTARMTT